jgi:hypothetical protein
MGTAIEKKIPRLAIGTHPDQIVLDQKIATPVPYKAGSPLLSLSFVAI